MSDETAFDRPLDWEFFSGFRRREPSTPIISVPPPDWAAAAHAIVVSDTVHYFWSRRETPPRWILMHATAPVQDPADVSQDTRNPIVTPTADGFFDEAIEYPFPFFNPADGRYYMYHRGKGSGEPEQTGLLVSEGDFGVWRRVSDNPVIPSEFGYEADGSTHVSAAVSGDTIHIVYTGKSTRSYEDGLTMCHATAPLDKPEAVIKNPANPVFAGSGEQWDSRAVRETEILKDPEHFHILYGGYDGRCWRIGHVRTRDFVSFEANPHNPVFSPSEIDGAWDCQSVLTAQVFRCGGMHYMVYAGMDGATWQTGLAVMEGH